MKIPVGETEYEAVFNAFTPIAFSRCFSVMKKTGSARPKDIAEAVGVIAETLSTFGMPAIEPILEIFYACIKTADPKFDVSFDDWVMTFPADAYDMGNGDGWAADVMKRLIEPNFFPARSDEVEAAPAEATDTAAAE